MDAEWARFINCLLHALNKCLEQACKAAFGEQGLGQNTCFQMIYNAVAMIKRIKKDGGNKLLDKYLDLVAKGVYEKEEWMEESMKNFPQQCEQLINNIELNGLDEIIEEMTATFRSIQDPVWTRWKTIILGARFVIKNNVILYWLAVAIKQTVPSKSLVRVDSRECME